MSRPVPGDPLRIVAPDEDALPAGVVVRRTSPRGARPDYFVFAPEGVGADAPLVVAVHDISRDAEEQARLLAAMCTRYGAVLLAPHFSAEVFPDYQRLGACHSPAGEDSRADAVLDAMIDEVNTLTGSPERRIHLLGYAAGARFAMRYAMAHPDRVARGALAEAGAYTFPDPDRRFPRGLAGAPGGDGSFDPDRFLRVPLLVLEVAPQGGRPRRLEGVGHDPRSGPRNDGRAWVGAMQAAARDRRLESSVSYQEVEGPGHSFEAFVTEGALGEQVFDGFFGPPPDVILPASEHSGAPEAPRPVWLRWRRRHALMGLAGLVALALLTPLVLWANYRAGHVVSREAVVRGHIAEVGARLDGVVESVEVDEGDRVQAGQVVARLQSRHLEARVRQVAALLNKAVQELEVERLAIANERERLGGALREAAAHAAAARAELRGASDRAAEAGRQLELRRTLGRRDLVPHEQVRRAEADLRNAESEVAAARAKRNAAREAQRLVDVESQGIAVREKRIALLESEIEALRAELVVAETDLDGAVLRAPGDGAVVRRIVEPGGATVGGQPILAIWVGRKVWIETWVDEHELSAFGVGSEATVTIASLPHREFRGVVDAISVSTDLELPDSEVPRPRSERMRDTPVIAVRIVLDDPPADLFPGLSAEVGIRKRDG